MARCIKSLGSGPSNSANDVTGMGGRPVAVEMACHRIISQSSVQDRPIKISEDLSDGKNIVFNVEKLLNDGIGLKLQRKAGKNRSQQNELQIVQI